eukprot:CAMPEP_0180576072 /NCGR_PEP_ID=MMETSP1037_2-20121125/11227_1 /TAXON_ID=632150 /ORGANISM="Azadinium spinosum, Strain 3D9" /LENGTH=172 /DNA_ID=CAMNT_0022593771 /DNA_START=49 /DNA_END=565 /DNA_ORIENTATION=-
MSLLAGVSRLQRCRTQGGQVDHSQASLLQALEHSSECMEAVLPEAVLWHVQDENRPIGSVCNHGLSDVVGIGDPGIVCIAITQHVSVPMPLDDLPHRSTEDRMRRPEPTDRRDALLTTSSASPAGTSPTSATTSGADPGAASGSPPPQPPGLPPVSPPPQPPGLPLGTPPGP